jgi:hypothetical protein
MLEGLVDPAAPSIAIAFDTGRVQLMKTELDEKPILVETGLRPAVEAGAGNRLQVSPNPP